MILMWQSMKKFRCINNSVSNCVQIKSFCSRINAIDIPMSWLCVMFFYLYVSTVIVDLCSIETLPRRCADTEYFPMIWLISVAGWYKQTNKQKKAMKLLNCAQTLHDLPVICSVKPVVLCAILPLCSDIHVCYFISKRFLLTFLWNMYLSHLDRKSVV